MTSSAPPSNATIRSKTLGCGELSSCRSSLRIVPCGGGGHPKMPPSAGSSRVLLFGAARERVLGRLRASDHLVHTRFVAERPLDRLLGRLIVVVVDLLVVLGVPVDEDADQNAVVVRAIARDDTALDRVDHGARDG